MRTPILAKDCTVSCSLSSSSTKDIVLPLVLMLGIFVIFLIGLDACKSRGLRPDITSVQCVEILYDWRDRRREEVLQGIFAFLHCFPDDTGSHSGSEDTEDLEHSSTTTLPASENDTRSHTR